MNVTKAELIITAGNKSQFPEMNKPEVAFAGKSNVGKSSLLNCLVNRKALARTSSQPGKTQTINFYNVQDEIRFVDLPGYGYAKVSKTEREKWGKLIEDYLCNRENLREVILLIDIRHEVGKNDKMMYDWIAHYYERVNIIATKADKLNRSQVQKHIAMVKKGLGLRPTDRIMAFSSVSKLGKDEIWSMLDGVIVDYNNEQAEVLEEVSSEGNISED
ncbi:ribosome biogenesis GTP-binding protein YihA/YsxC [Niameybacter massiliensis]|uniref:Probable GTP-binding protein EngB n=1 Tax=Holtiella tumoricola TaxID=3018743 RepID=A0AA42IYW0_9FIRM|nr:MULTISPECIES: ribosome biogenesis GTP-binding protein YihA/YsxC [Lachnospirales]MDA3730202.1 ribosome biogenesis GTP-binding protein YihA/YsxC [Holtiella tumoricola]